MVAEADLLVRSAFADDPAAMVYCRVLLARTEMLRHEFARAHTWLVEARGLTDGLPDDPWFTATRLYIAGQLDFIAGRGPEALPVLERGAQLVDRTGDAANATICFADLALVAETSNDFDLMRTSLDTARRIARDLDLSSLELAMAARVACAAVLQGHDDEAAVLLDDVIRWAGDVVHRPALAFAMTGLARLRYRQGRLAEAADAARRALELPLFEQVRVRAALTEILAAAESTDRGLPAI